MAQEQHLRGLYRKYRIEKADGSPVSPDAEYFVLRLDTDPAARSAVLTYAFEIEESNPAFARDLRMWVAEISLEQEQ